MEHQKFVLPSDLSMEKDESFNNEILLSYRLRSLRKAQGKTLKEMAEIIGITISTYAGYETPAPNKYHRNPSLEKIVRIANYFGVSIDYLIGVTDKKPRYNSYDVTELAERAELAPHVKATFDFAIAEIAKQNNTKILEKAGV